MLVEKTHEVAAGEGDGIPIKAMRPFPCWLLGRRRAMGASVAAGLMVLPFHFFLPPLQSRSKLYSWKALRAVARSNLQAFSAVSA